MYVTITNTTFHDHQLTISNHRNSLRWEPNGERSEFEGSREREERLELAGVCTSACPWHPIPPKKNAKHINTYTASKTSSVSWPICFHACLFLLNNSTALLALLAFNRRTKRESTGYSTRTQHSYLSVSTTLSPHILLLTMRGKRSVWLCSICLVLGWVAILASWRGVYFLVLSLYILLVCRFLKEILGSIILPPLLHRNIRQFITEVGEHVELVFPALRPLRNCTC